MENIKHLIPNKDPKDTTIVVGMSGGVDSSVVAAVLKQQGYNVIGVTLKMWSPQSLNMPHLAETKCGSQQDAEDAKKVCEFLHIEHHILNYETEFKELVVDDFVDTYKSGATPIPCIKCNGRVKFSALINKAKQLNADAIATGHYVQKVFDNNLHKNILLKSEDLSKDQSYFLFLTTQEQLDYTIFPLGLISDKEATRKLAQELNLHVSEKKDSQDICFIPHGDYRELINHGEQLSPEGEFVDQNGKVLGTHSGITHYTVGQRKGLGINLGFPAYVTCINPNNNQITIGTKHDLQVSSFAVADINWLGEEIPAKGLKCLVKVRSTHKPVECLLTSEDGISGIVQLKTPEVMVAPGQAAVFYDQNRVLGGGWILNNTNKINVKID